MAPLNDALKTKVVSLLYDGKQQKQILEKLKSEENFTIGRRHLAKFIKRFKETNSIQNKPKPGPPVKDVTPELLNYIDKKMEENDETTAADLQRLIEKNFNLSLSISKIKRIRRKLGWLSTSTKYCQLVREVNRAKRLEYCRRCLENAENFEDVVFTDECTVALENSAHISFHRWWEPAKLKGRPKHPLKVHVWAGISKSGATDIAIFSGILDATFFVHEILEKHLEPFVQEFYPDHHRFFQDNDPKHTSRVGKNYYESSSINWWESPPESP